MSAGTLRAMVLALLVGLLLAPFYPALGTPETTSLWEVEPQWFSVPSPRQAGLDQNSASSDLNWETRETTSTVGILGPLVPNTPQTDNDVAPVSHVLLQPLAIGDELFQLNVQTPTGDTQNLGVEWAIGYWWVTGGNAGTDPNKLYKIDVGGNLVATYNQPSSSTSWGWRDLAWDGTLLYGSVSNAIDCFDPVSEVMTTNCITGPLDPNRALAYDPDTDHFWAANWGSDIYEFDRSGTIINQYSNALGAYGMAWDMHSDGGPYLWVWSQDGDPPVLATQIDPTTGAATGVFFQGIDPGWTDNMAGGVAIVEGDHPDYLGRLIFAAMHQCDSDTIVGYDLGITECIPVETADFAWTPLVPGAGEAVTFTGTATGGAPITYTWDFGDGQSAVGAEVQHTYSSEGTYSVVMTASNACGTASASHNLTVGTCEPAYGADFFWVPISPTLGQWVTFNGHVSGTEPFDFEWDWGDGGTGSGATAAHMYAAMGDYTVRMTATNGCGESLSSSVLAVATSTTTPYYAFVNQPWDWVEGLSMPDATVQATLRRGGSPIASASATADAEGFFALEFRDGNGHMDVLVGDEVVLAGGGVDGTIVVVDTVGGINVAEDTVVGQVSGGVFPAQGTAWVGYATALNFMVEPVAIDENGFFSADLSGQVDIDDDHVAKIAYIDPEGNEVVQVFYPGGLGVRSLIGENRIEGVTAPSTTVRALVADADGPKGTGLAVSDETGFYSMNLYDRGYPVDLCLGDRITVTKAGRTRQMELTMYHVSYMQTWDGRIDGTIHGLSLPAGGTEGRIDLWSAVEKRWYTQYIGIGSDGSYGADFSDLVDMTPADIMRLWVTLADGTQQAALGWALHVGVSTSDEVVWGFTMVSSTAQITLYRGLEGDTPVDVIGTASATADKRGYFSTTIMVGGSPQDIMPSNVLVIKAGEHAKTLFVGLVDLVADVDNDAVLVLGPAGSVAHVEGRRHGVLREDAVYQEDYGWARGTVGPNGKAILGPLSFDVQVDDWFDVTCYLIEEGIAIHQLIAVPEETISIMMVYLPLVFSHAQQQ